jgi:hypothetical protein
MGEIRRTVAALLAANGNLIETVVLRVDGGLSAHVCAIRTYARTWSVQHLAARQAPGQHLDASARVNLAISYYAELREDIEWIKMYFRPNNPWPARIFGGFARSINDPATSDFRTFDYLTASRPDGGVPPAGVQVRPAGPDDFGLIEQWFISRGRGVELGANDFRAAEAGLSTIGGRFAAAGLIRRREILVAERAGRPAGFAALEFSSLGMNFSELTNAFTVHVIEENDAESRVALALHARRRYQELGRTFCIALDDSRDLTAFETAGFAKAKEYSCWTFHRTRAQPFEEYRVRLFSDRRAGGV